MTNNTTEQDLIDLFPDNTTNEISASDMRVTISSIFNDRQETINKVPTSADLPIFTNIYEGSLVVIWDEPGRVGLYISKINQPQQFTDLLKIAGE